MREYADRRNARVLSLYQVQSTKGVVTDGGVLQFAGQSFNDFVFDLAEVCFGKILLLPFFTMPVPAVNQVLKR